MESRYKSSTANLISYNRSSDNLELQRLTQESLTAAKEASLRGFHLHGLKDPKNPHYFVIGCQGNGGFSQKEVAELMNKIASISPEERPDFILFLGDNLYDYGANSPLHEGFNSCFHQMYGVRELAALSGIPCFLILGNHDANFHKKAILDIHGPKGKDAEINQIAHTYLPDGVHYKEVSDLKKLFEQKNLHLRDLNQYNMPRDYYYLLAGETQIFCLDSNFLVKDYLDYYHYPENPNNQIKWLVDEIKKAKDANREIVIALHHLPFTAGKRDLPGGYDSLQYLTAEQLAGVNKVLGSNTHSYNELIRYIFRTLNLAPDKVLGAHDHFISIDDSPEFFQLTCGGGGGDLQSCESVKRHPEMQLHLKNNGFASINKNEITIHTTHGYHLRYDCKNHRFLRAVNMDEQVEKLREIAIASCDEYLSLLKNAQLEKEQEKKRLAEAYEAKKSTSTYMSSLWSGLQTSVSAVSSGVSKLIKHFKYDPKAEEIVSLHDTRAYFNQINLPHFEHIITYLTDMCKKLPNGDLTFRAHLMKNIKSGLDLDLELLSQSMQADISRPSTPKFA